MEWKVQLESALRMGSPAGIKGLGLVFPTVQSPYEWIITVHGILTGSDRTIARREGFSRSLPLPLSATEPDASLFTGVLRRGSLSSGVS